MSNQQLIKLASPALPLSPTQFDKSYQDQLNNVHRLFYNRLVGAFNQVTGPFGGQYIDCPNGLFFNTADQTFGATNTAYSIVFDQTYLTNAVALQSGSTSKVEVSISGIYNFQYTGQVLSSSSSAKTIFVWIARNGTDIGYSTRAKTVSSNGQYTDVAWTFDIDLQAGDYIELKASVTDTNLKLDAQTASSPHPGIPSSVMTVNFIAPLPATLPTPPSP
jgi:hypothetical protein